MNNENNKLIQYDDGYLNRTPIFQFILLSCLFPLWGAAASLNDILITQFKSVFTLSDFASALVQSAFYGGYFLISIPASIVIRKTSYKTAILCGLLFYIVGCSLFFPASHMATYTMFLFAVFSIAIGLGFLETASNTYSTMLGPRDKSTLRLNISQTFYPIGAASGILLGKYLGTFIRVITYILAVVLPLAIIILEKYGYNVSEIIYLTSARIFNLLKNSKKSKTLLLNLINKYPESYYGHKLLAQTYEKEGGMRKAIDEYVKAIDIKSLPVHMPLS